MWFLKSLLRYLISQLLLFSAGFPRILPCENVVNYLKGVCTQIFVYLFIDSLLCNFALQVPLPLVAPNFNICVLSLLKLSFLLEFYSPRIAVGEMQSGKKADVNKKCTLCASFRSRILAP